MTVEWQEMIKIDLHTHTMYSPDSSIRPETIVDQLHAHPFIKAVAITDHDTVEGYRRVKRLASPYEDVLIVPGVEISAVGGDIIALGVAQLPQKPWTIEKVISFTKSMRGAAIAAHPYRAPGIGDLAMDYPFDAIETLNGISASHENRMAESLASQTGLPGVAGSDAHHADELWTVYNEVDSSMNVDDLLDAIKRGNVRVTRSNRSIHF